MVDEDLHERYERVLRRVGDGRHVERVDLVDELTRRDGLAPLAQDELALRVRELAAARLVQDRQDLLRLVALDEELEERVGQGGEAVRVRTEALGVGWVVLGDS